MAYEFLRDALALAIVFLLVTFSRRSRFRFVIISSGIVSVVALYLWQAYEPSSHLATVRARGKVAESYFGGGRNPDILFRLNDRNELFRYKRWFPRFAEIETQLRVGNIVTVEFTVSGSDSTKAQLWQIESEGRVLVTRGEILSALDAKAQYGLYLGLAFGLLALGLFTWEVVLRRRVRNQGVQ